jgi:hypothetical protein
MSNLREMAPRYVRQYRRARDPLRAPYDPDTGMEVVAALCNRDALLAIPEVQAELAEEDVAFAEALFKSSDEWRAELFASARGCRFASSPWWRAIEARSRELRSAKAV